MRLLGQMTVKAMGAAVIALMGASFAMANDGTAAGQEKVNVAVAVAEQPDGLYRYTYTVTNQTSEYLYPYAFGVRAVGAPTPKREEIPEGWKVRLAAGEGERETAVEWTADEGNHTELPPGKSLTLSFVSIRWPVMQSFGMASKTSRDDRGHFRSDVIEVRAGQGGGT